VIEFVSTFENIPTNIISGFLGAGKTTAIQHLLKHKPASENWAVIVNEFGQVGVDGALLETEGVSIKEIPGGCLCCVGSQSLSVGLNQIIRTVKPQRILIEPTGLGHPAKLIESLTGEFYKSVLDLKAVINLIDARNLNDSRYLENETFVDQSSLADILVATKLDTYSEDDKKNFLKYAMSFKPAKRQVAMVEHGQLELRWLDLSRLQKKSDENNPVIKKLSGVYQIHAQAHSQAHSQAHHKTATEKNRDNADWQMRLGNANGYYSAGWKLADSTVLVHDKLLKLLESVLLQVGVERVKGVVNTDRGWLSINLTQSEQEIQSSDARTFSVLEIISADQIDADKLDSNLRASSNTFKVKV